MKEKAKPYSMYLKPSQKEQLKKACKEYGCNATLAIEAALNWLLQDNGKHFDARFREYHGKGE